MRLTKKKWHQLCGRKKDWFEYTPNKYTSVDRIYKLGQLEDIEEELGIDLALRHKIETSETTYIKNGNGEIIKGTVECFYSKLKAFGVMCQNKEYGNVLIACHIND